MKNVLVEDAELGAFIRAIRAELGADGVGPIDRAFGAVMGE